MASYEVQVAPSALRDIERVGQRNDRNRILDAIHTLADNPRPHGSLKLKGTTDAYRIRVGNYRILYTIRDNRLLVMVVRVGDRRNVYN